MDQYIDYEIPDRAPRPQDIPSQQENSQEKGSIGFTKQSSGCQRETLHSNGSHYRPAPQSQQGYLKEAHPELNDLKQTEGSLEIDFEEAERTSQSTGDAGNTG